MGSSERPMRVLRIVHLDDGMQCSNSFVECKIARSAFLERSMWSEHAMDELLLLLYGAALSPSSLEGFLEKSARLLGARACGFTIDCIGEGESSQLCWYGLEAAAAVAYQETFFSLDPWRKANERALVGRWNGSEQLVEPASFARSAFGSFMQRWDLRRLDSLVFLRTETERYVFAAAFADADREFALGERMLNRIAPHLLQATKMRFRMEASQTVSGAFRAHRNAMVMVNRAGRVLRANEAAEKLFRSNDGVCVERGILRLTPSSLLLELFRASTRHECWCRRVLRPSGSSPYWVVVLPERQQENELPNGYYCTLHILDPEPNDGAMGVACRRLLGLSPAEARVAQMIGEGKTPRDIAALLGTSYNTVRAQLRSIYAKTGSTRQAALAQLVRSLPPVEE